MDNKQYLKDLSSLKESFNSSLDPAREALGLLTNEVDVVVDEGTLEIINISDFKLSEDNIQIKIKLVSGLSGVAILDISKSDASVITAQMMGMDSNEGLDDELIYSGISETTNQVIGKICLNLSKSFSETVDISIPEPIATSNNTLEQLFENQFDNCSVCSLQYIFTVGEHLIKIVFLLNADEAVGLAKRITDIDNQNFMKSNPTLAKNVAEYFTLLGVKYKAIYSMIGVMDEVSVLEINSIHTLQCLDIDVINNYNIVNHNTNDNLYNVFIFEKGCVSDVKKQMGLLDDEESTWDMLNELNNQFYSIFSEYSSDNSLRFDKIESNNFLELPDNQYVLVTFRIGIYKFYQLLSYELINSLNFNLSATDRDRIKGKSIDVLLGNGTNTEADNIVTSGVEKIPEAYRKLSFEVSAVLGEKTVTIRELLHFGEGYVVHFNKKVIDNIDICINNIKKAEGEVGQLAFNKSNNYAVKIHKF